ncbi:MAG: hypothetical protein EA341_08825 [Mongoliibacter sp.]|uniref:hypothetical protein n=1 Tax=Mongoliibacter sp. TaxID=2022438 RepID=UPI0012F2B9E2|nr:hypothetical protein [Mongoliibacter sp.]TVP49742.1 MAG: hypothetical protein EA341_08825 [Mongoliibacter sp.]
MMRSKNLLIQKKSPLSETTYLTGDTGILGSLKLPILQNSGYFKGKELYTFLSLDLFGNTYRIYKEGKSIGYIHLHAFRNLAQVNLVEEGPYQFSIHGLLKNNWSIRQGKKSLDVKDNDLFVHLIDTKEEELITACGLFIAAKIKKDLIVFVPVIVMIWTLLIIF